MNVFELNRSIIADYSS